MPPCCSKDNVLNPLVKLTGVHELTHQVSLANPLFSLRTQTQVAALTPSLELHHNGYVCVALKYLKCPEIIGNITVYLRFSILHNMKAESMPQFCIVGVWYHDRQNV